MKTIDQVKEDLAHDYDFRSWREMFLYTDMPGDLLIDKVAKRYAAEALRSASEIAEVETVDIDYEKAGYKGRTYNTPAKTYEFTTPGHGGGSNYEVRVYKQSILNLINELK